MSTVVGAVGIALSIVFSVGLALILTLISEGKQDRETINELEKEINELKERYGNDEKDISYWKKLVHELADESHRNGAIAEGLAEDLSALKAYNEEEVEEKLRKIRDIRAEEERIRKIRQMGIGTVVWPYDFTGNEKMSVNDASNVLSRMAKFVNVANTTTLFADGQAMYTIRN